MINQRDELFTKDATRVYFVFARPHKLLNFNFNCAQIRGLSVCLSVCLNTHKKFFTRAPSPEHCIMGYSIQTQVGGSSFRKRNFFESFDTEYIKYKQEVLQLIDSDCS